MNSNIINAYLENIAEGKVWDKVKKVWRDHKGKIITGLAAGTAATIAAKKLKGKTKTAETKFKDKRAATARLSRRKQRFQKKVQDMKRKAAIAKAKCGSQPASFSMGKFMGCGPEGQRKAQENARKFFGNNG